MSKFSPATVITRWAVASAIGIAGVLAFASPASAHNYYTGSTPGINEVLTTLPDEFIVTTNDNLLDLGGTRGGFFMEVKGPDGLYYGDGCVSVNGPSVTTTPAVGPPGEYSLGWQVVSTDGHTVSGEVPFSWQPAAGAESTAKGSVTPPNCGKDGATVAGPTDAQGAADDANSDILWIAGAIVAVAIAVVATLLLMRPKKNGEQKDAAGDSHATTDVSPDASRND